MTPASAEYIKLLRYISETPPLLSILYDLSLLPETVSDTEVISTRGATMAAVIAYRIGAGDLT